MYTPYTNKGHWAVWLLGFAHVCVLCVFLFLRSCSEHMCMFSDDIRVFSCLVTAPSVCVCVYLNIFI